MKDLNEEVSIGVNKVMEKLVVSENVMQKLMCLAKTDNKEWNQMFSYKKAHESAYNLYIAISILADAKATTIKLVVNRNTWRESFITNCSFFWAINVISFISH
jgi:hypothetical protein